MTLVKDPERVVTPDSPGRGRATAMFQRSGLFLAWLGVIAVFGVLEPDTFLSVSTLQTLLGSQAVLLVLTVAVLIPLIAGDFDLSIGYTMGFSAMVMAVLTGSEGWSLLPAIGACLASGVAIGCFNGFWVAIVGVSPFIATLGSGTIVAGFTGMLSGDQTVGGVSESLIDAVVIQRIFGISLAFYYGLILCVALWGFLEFTGAGRRLLFVGRSRRVARLSGMRVQRLRFGALVASATIAALAGILLAGYRGTADPDPGGFFLLGAFSAAFLGATTIRPGFFNPLGALAAVYFLATGVQGLILVGVPSYVQNIFYGSALVLGLAAAHLTGRRDDDDDRPVL